MNANSRKQELKRPSPLLQMVEYLRGKMYTQLIFVAVKLNIAEILADDPKTLEELASATNTHAPSLYRALRALTKMGIFDEKEPKVFSQNSLSKILHADSPLSMKETFVMVGSNWYDEALSNILYSIKTGKQSFGNVFGMNLFDYLKDHPEDHVIYNNTMTSSTNLISTTIINSYDFSKFQTIVDVGGGHGILLRNILKAHPSLQGILYDIPEVIESARKIFEKENLLKRCKLIGGNFFQEIPKGGDVYILRQIIHDYDDDDCLRILRNCHESMNPESKLLVIEHVISKESPLYGGILMDLEMMIFSDGGQERTEEEFKQLFTNARFKLTKIIPVQASFILEGHPI